MLQMRKPRALKKDNARRKKKINPYGVESWPDCGVSYGQVFGGLFLTF
jgi:hypothetical protein